MIKSGTSPFWQFSTGEDDALVASINTTPLVDVMLVLLIVFLITIPVAIQAVPVNLPQASSAPNQTHPENIVLSVDADGAVYWNLAPVMDRAQLAARLAQLAQASSPPEVQVRGDRLARYGDVDAVVQACRQAGMGKVGFVSAPDVGVAP